MGLSFHNGNSLSNAFVSFFGNDRLSRCFYYGNMAAEQHDWYFKDWLKTLMMRQSQVVEATGWSKGKVSKLVNGGADYDRRSLNGAALALNLQPFELLMHPEDAMRIRRLRETALSIAADNRIEYRAEPSSPNQYAIK